MERELAAAAAEVVEQETEEKRGTLNFSMRYSVEKNALQVGKCVRSLQNSQPPAGNDSLRVRSATIAFVTGQRQ